MAITTNKSTDFLANTLDSSLKSSKTFSSKNTSELFKSSSTSYSKFDDFKNVLNSKSTQKDKDSDISNENRFSDSIKDTKFSNNDKDNVNDLDEKLKDLEDDTKTDSKKDANEVLAELLELLAGLGIKKEDLSLNGKSNSEFLKSIIDKLNNEQGSNRGLNSILEKIMQMLKNESIKEGLDAKSLKSINNILNNLSSKFSDDKSEMAKELKDKMKNLMSEISNMLNDKQNQANKVLTLEDMLNKNYSQTSSDESSGEDATASKDSKEFSKEDKFLNSLIDDKKDDSLNKINLFASRTTTVQNQGVGNVRGLTINKATFVDDLIKDVKYMNTNSIKELTVKINPGNLGEITIKLIEEDGLMKANLKANSKETTALLAQNLTEIKKQLSEQNIKISDVNIELYQDDTTFFKGQGFEGQLSGEQNRQQNNSQNKVSNVQSVEGEELEENLAEENNNLNLLA